MGIDIGISEDKRKKIVAGLARLLADSYTLYLKTYNFTRDELLTQLIFLPDEIIASIEVASILPDTLNNVWILFT